MKKFGSKIKIKDIAIGLKKRVIEILVTMLLTAIIGAVAYKANVYFKKASEIIKNISKEESVRVAKTLIGPIVGSPIPFIDNGKQYIVVMAKFEPLYSKVDGGLPEDNYFNGIYLISGYNGVYTYKTIALDVDSSIDSWEEFGVTNDIDKNGHKEVFTVDESGGSSSYGIDIILYDIFSKNKYQLEATGSYGQTYIDVELDESAKNNKNVDIWLREKIKELKPFKFVNNELEQHPYDKAIEDWVSSNGRGFYNGKMKELKYTGDLSGFQDLNTIACQVEDENYVWTSYFKGAVFGYSKKGNFYFPVYVPKRVGDWADSLISTGDVLIIGVGNKYGVLGYDIKANSLRTLGFISSTTNGSDSRISQYELFRNLNSLSCDHGPIYYGNMPLTLGYSKLFKCSPLD